MKPDDPGPDPTLPTTLTTSGRVVYDPSKAPRVEVDPAAAAQIHTMLEQGAAAQQVDAREVIEIAVPLLPANDGALITELGQDAARAHTEAVVKRAAAPA